MGLKETWRSSNKRNKRKKNLAHRSPIKGLKDNNTSPGTKIDI